MKRPSPSVPPMIIMVLMLSLRPVDQLVINQHKPLADRLVNWAA
jgi:hypothetical protein